jgi:hypothetical protein
MPSIPLPTIKIGLKTKARVLPCEVFSEAGKIVQIYGDVIISCVDFPNLRKGFLIDNQNLFNNEHNEEVMVISEQSFIPIPLIHDNSMTTDAQGLLLDQIFDECQSAAKDAEFERPQTNSMADRITLLFGMVIGAGIVFWAASYFMKQHGG